MEPKQQIFEFTKDTSYIEEDFIVSTANLEAYNTLKSPVKWPSKRLLLLGETGSGKSHLGKIWTGQHTALVINNKENVFNLDLNSHAILCEDIELIKDEKFLVHLINFCNDHSVYLLMTASTISEFALPDLKSRINSTYKVIIKPPDEELLKIILRKLFTERQLKLSEEVMDYIFSHTERNYSFINHLVNEIDKLSLEKKRNITIPLIKLVLEK